MPCSALRTLRDRAQKTLLLALSVRHSGSLRLSIISVFFWNFMKKQRSFLRVACIGLPGRLHRSSNFSRHLLDGCVITVLIVGFSAKANVNVVQHHNHVSRDGLYVDPAFTTNAAAGLTRALTFDGTISGNVYAQPLYIEGGPGGRAVVIAVTESNNVYALDANDGSIVWQRNVGAAVPLSVQPCGNIDPLGITGTPVVDLPSRSLFFDGVVTPDAGATTKHLVYSLNVDTGAINSGWPVDVGATATFGSTAFEADTQNQRGGLLVLGGSLYVPYGGHYGDCGTYHGWLVGIPLNNPTSVTAWATAANGGGAWGVGGAASDGTNVFITTGNTFGVNVWGGGEAVIRFQPGPVFSGMTADYWVPTNWVALDAGDVDIGGSGPLLVDVPGATPSQLLLAMGKDGNTYLLDRNNLGGISTPQAQAHFADAEIIQAAATYQTAQGTYVVYLNFSELTAFRITPTNPPTLAAVWSANQNGYGSPFVTSTDGTNNVVVWGIGCEGDQRLHGFDGDTGAVVYSGGGTKEAMAGTRHMSTAIAARGRIYVATDNKVYAFMVKESPVIISQPTNQSVVAGDNATIELSASGTTPLSYQWMLNGTNLAGATDDTLSLSNVQPSQAGPYSAIVTNVVGSVTSSVAQLTVLVTPRISKITLAGATVSFSSSSVQGRNYILEYKDTLDSPAWISLLPSVAGTGVVLDFQDTNAVSASRFYRIRSY
jgi:hypothetical protein